MIRSLGNRIFQLSADLPVPHCDDGDGPVLHNLLGDVHGAEVLEGRGVLQVQLAGVQEQRLAVVEREASGGKVDSPLLLLGLRLLASLPSASE